MTDRAGAPRSRASELSRRVASGLVLAAGAIAVAWAGGPLFVVIWTIAGVIVGVEWAWLAAADPQARRRASRIVAVALGAAGAATGLSGYLPIDPLIVAALVAAGGAGAALAARPSWSAGLAAPYGAAAFVGVILLRRDPQDGLLAVFWLFAVVWMTDIAAFAVGRTVGGPKLAPVLSPNKTWSGAIGGAVAGGGAGVAVAALGGVTTLWPVALIAFLAAVSTAAGDLIESAAKRAYGAKDAGRLIPGHGGAMDRLDGFLVAASLAAAIGVARGGADAAGQGLLRW